MGGRARLRPDGCTLDAEGAIWFADAFGCQVIRIREGGEITHRIPTPMPSFACMLGGDEGCTLFVMGAPGSMPEEVAGQAMAPSTPPPSRSLTPAGRDAGRGGTGGGRQLQRRCAVGR